MTIRPEWPAPPQVRALVTTRALGDMAREEGKRRLRALLPAEPVWLRQVHGNVVVEGKTSSEQPTADALFARQPGTVCAVMIADCMPVFLADEAGTAVAVAHAGWRGLAAGVIEATLDAMKIDSSRMLSWLGPAIGPEAYEVGEDVRAAFPGHQDAFSGRYLDLYAVARKRLAERGVTRVYGGGFCTYSDAARFFSYRRDRARERMAALIWLA